MFSPKPGAAGGEGVRLVQEVEGIEGLVSDLGAQLLSDGGKPFGDLWPADEAHVTDTGAQGAQHRASFVGTVEISGEAGVRIGLARLSQHGLPKEWTEARTGARC